MSSADMEKHNELDRKNHIRNVPTSNKFSGHITANTGTGLPPDTKFWAIYSLGIRLFLNSRRMVCPLNRKFTVELEAQFSVRWE